jgi:two-component sensor histidine kinase
VSAGLAVSLPASNEALLRRLRLLPHWAGIACGAIVTVPFLFLQEILGPDVPGNPFLVLLPGVLMASVLFRWRGGIAALTTLAGYADYYHLDGPGFFIDTPASLFALSLFVAVGLYVVALVHSLQRALARQEALLDDQRATMEALERARDDLVAAEARKDLFAREMQHRVKNAIAVIASVGRQTLRSAATMEEFGIAFDARLNALARTQSAIAPDGHGTGADLADLVTIAIDPFRSPNPLTVQGPPVRLGPKSALNLGLALHELATNAAKYGALSQRGAGLSVTWECPGGDVALSWVESTTEAPPEPTRKGFGSKLIERTASGLGGSCVRTVAPEGYRFAVRVPLASLAE